MQEAEEQWRRVREEEPRIVAVAELGRAQQGLQHRCTPDRTFALGLLRPVLLAEQAPKADATPVDAGVARERGVRSGA
eukprot:2093092-Prymnesium_polylepis.1